MIRRARCADTIRRPVDGSLPAGLGLLVLRAAGGLAALRQSLADYPQRQVLVALRGQHEPQLLHIRRAEPPVPRRRASRADQALGLQETDLGDADLGKLTAQLDEHLADAKVSAGKLTAHAGPRAYPPLSA